MNEPAIRIFVDADACPVKEEVYRIAERHGLRVYVVANSPIQVPRDGMVERVTVATGLDAADDWIAERADPTVIVVTNDTPLVDPHLFRLSRFSDGTKIVIDAGF